MANQDLKEKMRNSKIPQWKVAHEMGVSEMTLIRKMRFNLSNDDRKKVLLAINSIVYKEEFDDLEKCR